MSCPRLLAVAAVFLCAFAVGAATNVVEVVNSYTDLRLGEAVQIAKVRLTAGHLTLAIPSGVGATVLGKDGTPVGAFYRGSGTFTYESNYEDEFPVVRHNAKNNDVGVLVAADKLVISEPFEDVLVLGSGPVQPGGVPAAAPLDAFSRHLQLFGKEEAAPLGQLFALKAADGALATAVRAQINGARAYVHVLDGVARGAERLLVLRKPGFQSVQFKNSLFSALLSEQPFGRKEREEAPPRLILTNVDLTLTASDKNEAAMTVVETFVPQKRPVNALRMDLYSRYHIDGDREPRRFHVRSITDDQGRALSYSHGGDELIIGLAASAEAGKPFKLKFEIDGNFLYRPGGDNYWELGVEPWFPQPRLNEQAYTFHALIKVKKPFVPFSPGKTLRREVEGDYNVVETRVDQPIQFAAILAGKYHASEETRNGVTVRVATYAVKNPAAVQKLTNVAFAAIQYFPTFLGPFPFDEINILEKNDYGYGQAPPATVFITKEAFTPRDEEANEFVKGVNSRFAHELAHQYWGHVIKMGSPEEQWLTEAFAEYSAALFMRNAKGAGEYDTALANWRSDAREAAQIAPIPLASRISNPGDPALARLRRQQLIYSKGAYLLAALQKELGDQLFLTFLKSYQKSFRWKHGTTADVIGLLNFMTKRDYAPFFERYFYGTALPEISKR